MREGGFYGAAVRAFSLLFIALGVVLGATTIANGGGPGSVGILLGAIFVAIGALRLWAARGRRR